MRTVAPLCLLPGVDTMNDDNLGTRLFGLLMAVLMALLLGGIAGWFLKPSCEKASNTVVRIDTLTKVITHEPVTIASAPARVRFVHDTVYASDTVRERDTVYTSRPFVATLDTIIDRDTIGIGYRFPQHTFSVALRMAPDSIRYETRTITLTRTERPFLEYVGAFAIGGVLGYIIGN